MADPRAFELKFEAGDQSADGWRVLAFHWEEALDRGSRGTVQLLTRDTSRVSPEDLLGKTATLTVLTGEGHTSRTFHGVVLEASDTVLPGGQWRLEVTVAARVELLKLGLNTRLFQEKSVPDVVKAVLEEAGLDAAAQSWKTQGQHPSRPSITQWNESDWDFVLRLLSGEGIGMLVRAADRDDDQVVLFDDGSAQTPVAEQEEIEEAAPAAGATGVAHLHRVDATASVSSDAVMLRDYDFRRPSLDLSAKEKADGSAGREVYLHPGGSHDAGALKARSKMELERQVRDRTLLEARSDHPHLEPGRTFHLAAHERSELSSDYVVTSVQHQARRESADAHASYANAFQALPKDVPWRPDALEAPAPSGVEPAFVTGSPGAELHSNAFGQSKVRFPWDLSGTTDDKSSPWLRVGQLALGGSLMMPRVGFEVLVDHELADRDRPLVIGHLYNGEAPPPYELPGGATRSSFQTATTDKGSGANELRFEDSSGSEEIFLNASRDYTFSAEHDATVSVNKDDQQKVGSNQSLAVASNLGEEIVGARTTRVAVDAKLGVTADFSDGVKGPLQTTVGAMRKQTIGGDLAETVTGKLDRTVGGLQAVTGIGGVQRTVKGSSTTTVGAAWLEAVAMSRSSSVGGTRTETVAGLKLIKAKTMSVDCGKAHVTNCAALQTDVGGDKNDQAGRGLALTAGGGISIEAENINIVAESRLLFRIGASSLELTPQGVTLKSTSLDLTGTKKLGSTQHGSGS
ncbi:MAG TPA: type VI secretion system tip protein TssI/VgrG [Myxococcaceae bacterium]|nr:type VI secretion system tip protein TssI/VgrG [Myxococcaceae bacterium]